MKKNPSLAALIEKLEKEPLERTGHLYHPIPFPEFDHLKISSNKKEVYKKWNIINGTVHRIFNGNITGKTVLDIGANAGFYTFNFAKQGASVTAFEPHSGYSTLGQRIIAEKNLPGTVHWFNDNYQWLESMPCERFDLGLILSTYQWMAAGGKEMEYASNALKHLSGKVNYLFFELGFNNGNSHLKTDKLNHYAHLIEHLNQHTDYTYFNYLGKTRLWRNNIRYLVLCSNDSNWQDSRIRKLIAQWHI